MRAAITILVVVASFTAAAAPCLAAQAERPNVIVILTDDQGYGDYGFMGNPVIRTPNLDTLASASAQMKTFYVSPVCSPTRACLMTGRYNYRTRAIDTFIGRAMMDPSEVTIAEALREAGYVTGIFGKWHLGDNYPMRAIDQGFDEALVICGGGIGQPSDPPGGEGKYTDPVLFHNGQRMQAKGYCTDAYFDAAMKWIEGTRKSDRPFFAYIPTNAPHNPLKDIPEDWYRKYKAMDLSPVVVRQRDTKPSEKELDDLARIFAMISNIDDNVGRLMAQLREWKLEDNTIVIFFGDNGPAGRRYVGPLRGTKGQVYEGGIRTPLIVHWPARLKAGHASDYPAAHIDIMPTLLDACGVAVPKGLKLDGMSILPVLDGRATAGPDRTLFIQSQRGDKPVLYHNFMARDREWKLLNASGFGPEQLPGPPKFELYHVTDDPGERKNLAAEHPEIVERLKAQYEAWFKDVSSTRPDNYDPPRIVIGSPHENPVTLTHQDWRHTKGRQWTPDSNGCWWLRVDHDGKYDIRLRFPATETAGKAELSIGDLRPTAEIKSGATEYLFEDLPLARGDVFLQATLTFGDKHHGPHQVDVIAK
jgi:arylsulfatase A-like enzyme